MMSQTIALLADGMESQLKIAEGSGRIIGGRLVGSLERPTAIIYNFALDDGGMVEHREPLSIADGLNILYEIQDARYPSKESQ